jgi:arsenate reductase-like glutaredoxin family protein
LDANGIEPKEVVSASKKLGRKEASALAKEASKLIVAKGKKLSEFKTAGSAPKDAVDAMLGPTGNLRAPTLRVGKTLLVGFNEEVYGDVLT